MFFVIIPFIADGVANDWPQAVACLQRTLLSVLGNPEKSLRVMVVCQDRPPLKINDDRYMFLKTDHPKPGKKDTMAKHADKGVKIGEAFAAAKEFSPEYVMIVDADDLISNSLLSYVYQRPKFDAFCMKIGYQWKEQTTHFTICKRFNQVCGSAFVWRFNERLFPAWVGKNYSVKRIADQGHNLVEDAMDAEKFLVDKMTEPKAVYVTGHVNHMYEGYHNISLKRKIKNLFLAPLRQRRLGKELRAEFGLMHEAAR